MQKFKQSFNIILFSTICLMNSVFVNAQEFKARAAIDSSVNLIGKQSNILLECTMPQNAKVAWPAIDDVLTDKVEVIAKSKIDTASISDGRMTLQQHIAITSFDSGLYFIPPFRFALQNGVDTVASNGLAFKVITFKVDTTKAIFDIKKPYRLPITFREVLPWIIGALLLAILVVIMVIVFRRIQRNEPVFGGIIREKVHEPAHIVALRELDKLKNEKLWQSGRVKEHFTMLTDIARNYIAERFSLPAQEQTTSEIVSSLKPLLIEEEDVVRKLESSLKMADLVKFAKFEPLPDEVDITMMNVYLFVNNTKIEEVKTIEEQREELLKGKANEEEINIQSTENK